ncbi:MAG: hypothetical protein KGL02_08520 [Acidobacteriota bacterium]|nr:hypothetical protein [Acidobacteriota bacterium]
MRILKIGIVTIVVVVAAALITLRFTGLEPQYLDLQQLRTHNMIARPGLWLKGPVVNTPVIDWSFVNEQKHPGQSLNTILVETRTPYFIPHSVRVMPQVVDGRLYIRSHQSRMDRKFPDDKSWTANAIRDPRVRLKIGGKLYRATLVLVADRAQAMQLLGRNPETYEKGADGQEHAVGYDHVFRVFQREIPEYDSIQPGLSSAGLVPQASRYFTPQHAGVLGTPLDFCSVPLSGAQNASV